MAAFLGSLGGVVRSRLGNVRRGSSTCLRMAATVGVPGTVEYVRYMRERLEDFGGCCDSTVDEFWADMQEEAMLAANEEPLLASFLFATILNQKSLKDALAFHMANKIASASMPNTLLMQLIREALMDEEVAKGVRYDLLAVMERDPACTRFIDPFLYYKGFHALQVYRVAHWLWKNDRRPLAYFLQSQISMELQVDIHPAAQIGYGVFIDHATGVVIGETAIIGNNVTLLQYVTLGGSGMSSTDRRHPKIDDGVLIGAGATVLGNIQVGEGTQIGAGTLVLTDLPPHVTAVGVPARIVGKPRAEIPAKDMDQDVTSVVPESNGVIESDASKNGAKKIQGAKKRKAADK